MALSKKSYTSVQRVLQNVVYKIPLNKLWVEIHDEIGVGDISSKHLILSVEDHKKLRNWYILDAGVDPLTTKVTGSRLDVATIVRNEKWATESVFSGMINVNVISGIVPLIQGDAVTQSGTLLSVSAKDINIEQIDTVVLVENGIVARNWYQCCIPEELTSALMVYRGHGSEGMKSVSEWLKQLPPGIRKVGYFDFDPAGLWMAHDYCMHEILIPKVLDSSLVEGVNNKPEDHDRQLSRRPELGRQLTQSCQRAWLWMTEKNRKCAVTQERLTIKKRQLTLLPLLNNKPKS